MAHDPIPWHDPGLGIQVTCGADDGQARRGFRVTRDCQHGAQHPNRLRIKSEARGLTT